MGFCGSNQLVSDCSHGIDPGPIGITTVAATASPVAANQPESGLHLEHGDANAAGCYALEVWNGDGLIK